MAALLLSRQVGSVRASALNAPFVINVTNTNDAGTGSLRQAISDAVPGDTIIFSLATGSVITLTSGELLINKNLIINGPGADLLTVGRTTASGTPQFSIFHIASSNLNVTISGLTIANGSPDNGPAIKNDSAGTVTISGCVLTGNVATQLGGAIFSLGLVSSGLSGTLNLIDSTLSGNSASAGGGLYVQNKTVNIVNSTLSGNSGGNGGGINCQRSAMNIINSTIAGNTSPVGGGLYLFASTFNIRNTIIALNTTTAVGPDGFSVDSTSSINRLSRAVSDNALPKVSFGHPAKSFAR